MEQANYSSQQTKFCAQCGEQINQLAEICPKCGVRQPQMNTVRNTDEKDWLTALLLCLFVGSLGIHRFYTGHTAIGVVQLLTLGGCGIWTLIDLIMLVTGSYTDSDGKALVKR